MRIETVLSVRPRITELVFQLYGRSLHPELFEIHQTRQIERGGYIATVQITNAGHVVTWQYGNLTLTEVNSGEYNDLTVGFNWYWTDRIRVMFDWIHPVTIAGTTPFGATRSDIIGLRFDYNF